MDESSPAGPHSQPSADASSAPQSATAVSAKANRPPAVRSSSSAARNRRTLSAAEVACKRQQQTTLMAAVKLLSSCFSRLQNADPSSAIRPDSRHEVMDPSLSAGHSGTFQHRGCCQAASTAVSPQLPILQALCSQQELKAHVMTACQLVDPGMGYAGCTAANTGAPSSL